MKIIVNDLYKRVVITWEELIVNGEQYSQKVNIIIPIKAVKRAYNNLQRKITYPFSNLSRVRSHLDMLQLNQKQREEIIWLLKQQQLV